MKRWKHLRDAFIRSQKNYKQSKASGSQAAKKKRYIFNDELQFLRKIYEERETKESYNNGDEDNNIEELSAPTVPPAVTTVEGTAEVVVSKVKLPTRQHKKMDEVDLKILQALQKKEPEKKNGKLSFLESLLPHVDKFDDNQWLQCQMEFLQVISQIKNTYPFIPQTHNVYNSSTSQIQQFNQPSNITFTQPFNVPQMPHQAFTPDIHSPQFTSTPGPAPQLTCSPTTNVQTISNVPQQKSSAARHYENYSQVIRDENVESRSPSVTSLSSTTTIDFAEL